MRWVNQLFLMAEESKDVYKRQDRNTVRGGLSLQLQITNFNNYSAEDINSLTEEIMETADNFIKRKGVVFA